MNILTKLSASAFALISLFSITSCSPNTPAQKGYEKAKAHLKENIKVPNSLKINIASSYYVVVEEYIVGGGYPYQYKISVSAKNRFDMTNLRYSFSKNKAYQTFFVSKDHLLISKFSSNR